MSLFGLRCFSVSFSVFPKGFIGFFNLSKDRVLLSSDEF